MTSRPRHPHSYVMNLVQAVIDESAANSLEQCVLVLPGTFVRSGCLGGWPPFLCQKSVCRSAA